MEKTGTIIAMCAFAVLISGCDFIRKVAGRPDSDYLEAKRVIVEQCEAQKRQEADSVARAKRLQEEAAFRSAAAEASAQRLAGAGLLIPVSRISNLDRSALDNRYYVIIGSFTNPDNARALLKKAGEAGFNAVMIPYVNGRSAVALDPCDDIVKAELSLSKAVLQPFCPADSWILVVE